MIRVRIIFWNESPSRTLGKSVLLTNFRDASISVWNHNVAHIALTSSEERLQYGALPYRVMADGSVEFLLVTSRRTKRWIIPKGWPIKGLGPAATAAREAFEEAGVLGEVSQNSVGSFQYLKQLKDGSRSVTCNVLVFPLRVDRELTAWPESAQRELCWLDPEHAADRISDVGMRGVIETAAVRMRRA